MGNEVRRVGVKETLAELARQYHGNGVKYVAVIDGKQIYRPVYRHRMNLGLPVYFAVKNNTVEVINGVEGLEMLGRIVEEKERS